MTPLRHQRQSQSGKTLDAHKHVVVVIYMLAYSQSQMCNGLQKDVANFCQYHGLSDISMRALHEMGVSVGMTSFYKGVHDCRKHHIVSIFQSAERALAEKKLVVVIIDDYTNIHTRRRSDGRQTNNSHMATVLMRVFDLPAVAAEHPPTNLPAGINIEQLLNGFHKKNGLVLQHFCNHNAPPPPPKLMQHCFNPIQERLRLTTHMHGEGNNVGRVRGTANAHLIDCSPQPLKSYTNYRQASAIYLATPLQQYLKHFTILLPGDWPSQFYERLLAYNEPLPSLLRNTTAFMGPLHVSLNAQETAVLKYIIFFKALYHHLSNKTLANHPKPWRITLHLELVFGGWSLIRQPVLAKLQRFKDLQFDIVEPGG